MNNQINKLIMKVLRRGNIPKEKEITKVCGNCKCKFTYIQDDVKRDRDGKYVNCPECEQFIAV